MAQTERFETTSFDGRPAWLEPSEAPTFTYTFVGGRFGIGGESTSTHVLLPETETEALLKRNEKTTILNRSGNPVQRWDENVLPGNEPREDRHAVDVVSAQDLPRLVGGTGNGVPFWENWAGMKVVGEGDGRNEI